MSLLEISQQSWVSASDEVGRQWAELHKNHQTCHIHQNHQFHQNHQIHQKRPNIRFIVAVVYGDKLVKVQSLELALAE